MGKKQAKRDRTFAPPPDISSFLLVKLGVQSYRLMFRVTVGSIGVSVRIIEAR